MVVVVVKRVLLRNRLNGRPCREQRIPQHLLLNKTRNLNSNLAPSHSISGLPSALDSKHRKENDVKAKWNAWLNDRFQLFVGKLCDRVRLVGRRHAQRTMCGVISCYPAKIQNDKSNATEAMVLNKGLMDRLVESLCMRGRIGGVKKKHRGGKRKHASISQTKEFVLEIDDALLQLFETEFIPPVRDVYFPSHFTMCITPCPFFELSSFNLIATLKIIGIY